MSGVRYILAMLMASSLLAQPGDKTVNLPELMQDTQQWVQDNLDTNVLNSLPKVEDRAAQQFLRDLEQRFQGEYVVDLAGLRQSAHTILPLLERQEETRPYAAWLKSQMDYLDVAEEIRIAIPAPKVAINHPAPPRLNPPPKMERAIWIRKMSDRPWSA